MTIALGSTRSPVTDWQQAMRVDGMGANTIKRRIGTVRRFERHTGRAATTADMHDVVTFLAQYPNSTTRRMYLGDLDAFLAWMVRVGHLDQAVTATMNRPRSRKTHPRPPSTAALFEAMRLAEPRLSDLLKLGAYQGLRIHEAVKVRGEDVRDGVLWVCGKGEREDELPLHPFVAEVAARMPRTGWWFPSEATGGHMSQRWAAQKVGNLFARVGIAGNFHVCRHWCCTELLRSGATIREAQEFMRHASIATTAGYAAATQAEITRAVIRLPVPPAPVVHAA